jgi:hypothetical protein
MPSRQRLIPLHSTFEYNRPSKKGRITMLAHIPALVSAFLGGAALYLSVYLPTQALVFPTILAGFGTMLLAYSYGTLRQMTR